MIYASNGPGQAPTLIGYAANFIAAQQQGPAEAHWTAEYPEPFAAIDTILFNWVA
jgi:hypothetical protein